MLNQLPTMQTTDRKGAPVNVGTFVHVPDIVETISSQTSGGDDGPLELMRDATFRIHQIDDDGTVWVKKWRCGTEDYELSKPLAFAPSEIEVPTEPPRISLKATVARAAAALLGIPALFVLISQAAWIRSKQEPGFVPGDSYWLGLIGACLCGGVAIIWTQRNWSGFVRSAVSAAYIVVMGVVLVYIGMIQACATIGCKPA